MITSSVSRRASRAGGEAVGARRQRVTLLFFTRRTSGQARRMESLMAHFARTERRRLGVVFVDADDKSELAERLNVVEIPTIVLVRGRVPVGRLEGRAKGDQIAELIDEVCEGEG